MNTGRSNIPDSQLSRAGEGNRVAATREMHEVYSAGKCQGRLRSLCVMLIATTLTACTSSTDQVYQQSRTAASAAQTASMVLEAWLAGAAPRNYTSLTLQSVSHIWSDAEAQIRSAGSPEGSDRAELIKAIEQLSSAAARAQTGLRDRDRGKVEQAERDLRRAATTLGAYAKSSAPQQ